METNKPETSNIAKKLLRQFLRYDYDKFIPKKKINHYYGIHPSSAANKQYLCPRRNLMYKVYIENRDDYELPFIKGDPLATQTFEVGHHVHRLYQDQFFGPTGRLEGFWKNKKTGTIVKGFMPDLDKPEPWKTWTYSEPRIHSNRFNKHKDPFFDVYGSCDGILHVKNKDKTTTKFVLDIKTANSRNFDIAKEHGPPETYVTQLNIYMYFLEINQGIIMYINKDNNHILEFKVNFHRYKVEQTIKDLTEELAVYNHWEELPEIHHKCHKETSTTFKRCPFNKICKSCKTFDDVREKLC